MELQEQRIRKAPEILKQFEQYRRRQQLRIEAIKRMEKHNPVLAHISHAALINMIYDTPLSSIVANDMPLHVPSWRGECSHGPQHLPLLPEGYIEEIERKDCFNTHNLFDFKQ